MDGARKGIRSGETFLRVLDRVLSADSIENALATGVGALAQLARADVGALLLIEGGECLLEAWHPDDAATRARHLTTFRTAARAACAGEAGAASTPGAASITVV